MAAKSPGFTLIETLLGSATLVIFFVALAVILQMTTTVIGETRVRTMAQSILQERMEEVRNLSYVDVGIQGGIPSGSLVSTEVITVDSQDFTVETKVVYIDDPFDDLAPTDTLPNDYKRASIEVMWAGIYTSSIPLSLYTDITPKGTESDVSGGTLLITVFNANAEPLVNANVHIEADTIPAVNLDTLTDSNGEVKLPGAPVCLECYKITVTRSGYTTDKTYGSEEVANPNKPHMSVFEGTMSPSSFAIDQLSTVNFKAVRGSVYSYSPFQGVQMRVRGNKEIGRTVTDEPVYKYNTLITTGFGGQVTVNDMEWDTYTVSIPEGSSIDLAASWPFTPFPLLPGTNGLFTMVVQAASPNTLLVRLVDNTQAPIASASVQLINNLESYAASQSTGIGAVPDLAQTIFSDLPTTNTPYDLTVSSPGFLEAYTQATVSGDIVEDFILSPE